METQIEYNTLLPIPEYKYESNQKSYINNGIFKWYKEEGGDKLLLLLKLTLREESPPHWDHHFEVSWREAWLTSF